MKRKILLYMLILTAVALILMAGLILAVSYQQNHSLMKDNVRNIAWLAMDAIEDDDTAFLTKIDHHSNPYRFTYIDSRGVVLFDNWDSPANMDNHGSRTEIQSALSLGAGESERLSSTLDQVSYYYAVRLENGNVLRVSQTLRSVWGMLKEIIPYLVGALLLTFMLSFWFATLLTKRIVSPLNAIDLENPTENELYDELAPMVRCIEDQRQEIQSQLHLLQQKQDEFEAVVGTMREGLILLNHQARILTINQSASAILCETNQPLVGEKIFAVVRNAELQRLIRGALANQSGEMIFSKHGKSYQWLVIPAKQDETVSGVILLILDVTHKMEAESRRREFTANVSHELKTPLTAIRGYAELLMNRMMRPGDEDEFGAKIFHAADQMLTMINDIMILSRLDEGDFEEQHPCDIALRALMLDIGKRLEPLRREKQIEMIYPENEFVLSGNLRLMDEMIFNLVENAVKYNRIGGKIEMEIHGFADQVVVRIADDGIGIAPEEQDRVFERFYRVDKSHSRASGGTGLGLSIAKHACRQLGGKISLRSCLHVGTTIEVVLPCSQLVSDAAKSR